MRRQVGCTLSDCRVVYIIVNMIVYITPPGWRTNPVASSQHGGGLKLRSHTLARSCLSAARQLACTTQRTASHTTEIHCVLHCLLYHTAYCNTLPTAPHSVLPCTYCTTLRTPLHCLLPCTYCTTLHTARPNHGATSAASRGHITGPHHAPHCRCPLKARSLRRRCHFRRRRPRLPSFFCNTHTHT